MIGASVANLWWGQQIPAWYDTKGNFVVAKTQEKQLEITKQNIPIQLLQQIKQDDDVLDTWFSSWLWPISVFDGFKDPEMPISITITQLMI
jgi:valyl-tRNA synthetase